MVYPLGVFIETPTNQIEATSEGIVEVTTTIADQEIESNFDKSTESADKDELSTNADIKNNSAEVENKLEENTSISDTKENTDEVFHEIEKSSQTAEIKEKSPVKTTSETIDIEKDLAKSSPNSSEVIKKSEVVMENSEESIAAPKAEKKDTSDVPAIKEDSIKNTQKEVEKKSVVPEMEKKSVVPEVAKKSVVPEVEKKSVAPSSASITPPKPPARTKGTKSEPAAASTATSEPEVAAPEPARTPISHQDSVQPQQQGGIMGYIRSFFSCVSSKK